MAVKPTEHLEWVTDDDPEKFAAPSLAKRLAGWIKHEKPPFEHFNWAFRLMDRWLKWCEAVADKAGIYVTNASGAPNISDAVLEITTLDDADWSIVGPTGTKERWTVSLLSIEGGTFTLGDGSSTTNPIAYDATAATVQGELDAIYGSGNVTVVKDTYLGYDYFYITFESSPASIVADFGNLTLGADAFGEATLFKSSFVWSALDVLPEDTQWVELSVDLDCRTLSGGTAGTIRTVQLYGRANGGDPVLPAAFDGYKVASGVGIVSSAGSILEGGLFTRKLPVSGKKFEIKLGADQKDQYDTISVMMVLTGHGINQA